MNDLVTSQFAKSRSTEETMAVPVAPTRGRFRWLILGLLFSATTINYMDRQILAVLKGPLMGELHWTETDYSWIVIAFQLAYAFGWVSVGRLIDRLGVRIGLALVVGAWSLAAASHSLARTVVGFCLARIALGLGEGGAWPGCVKAVSEWFPRRERAIGTGIVNAGSAVGATLTPVFVPLVLAFTSWPYAFLITAFPGMIWLLIWLLVYRSPEAHPRVSAQELAYIRSDPEPPQGSVSWLSLLGHRQTWAFANPKTLSDPIWWFYLFWVPDFLGKKYALGLAGLALPVMLIYVMADVGSVGGGWLSMRLINRGMSVNAARKAVMLGCALSVVPVFLVSRSIGLWPSVLLIGVAAAAHQGFSANLFTVATDTVPRQAVSSVAGIGGMLATLASVGMARMVGFLLDTTGGSYAVPFGIASCSYLVALGVLHALLPRLEPMQLDA
jgi:ACS family hexuronate transporter-like MFS transporter